MNISLIKIKYMPKKDLVTHKRSKQVKTIQKDELFLSVHVCQQSSYTSYEFWTFIQGKMYTYISHSPYFTVH